MVKAGAVAERKEPRTLHCDISIYMIYIAIYPVTIELLTHFYPPLRLRNQVPTFSVRETQSLGQQMLNAPVSINGLIHRVKQMNHQTVYLPPCVVTAELSLFVVTGKTFHIIC